MLSRIRFPTLAVLVLALACDTAPPPQAEMAATPGIELKQAMRKLWEDHITWTRLYIVSAIARLPEKEATAQRLLKNQEEIGNAIKPFYGDAAGDQLTGLLKGHIMVATEIIDAAMRGDNAKKDAAVTRWGTNADSLAVLLSGANPGNWPLDDLKRMLHEHLDLTTQEVVAHLQKDWAGSVAAYDRLHDQILMMADALSSGIAKQFPEKAR